MSFSIVRVLEAYPGNGICFPSSVTAFILGALVRLGNPDKIPTSTTASNTSLMLKELVAFKLGNFFKTTERG